MIANTTKPIALPVTGIAREKRDKLNELIKFVEDNLYDWDTGLDAILAIVDKAASIYGNDWDNFLSATNYVMVGVYENGPMSQYHAQQNREFQGYFVGLKIPNGMSFQFDDHSNQVRHFWGAFATAASTKGRFDTPFGKLSNATVASVGNFIHDVMSDYDGPWWNKRGDTTIWDYSLSQTAIDIGRQVVSGKIASPADLSAVIETQLTGGNMHYYNNRDFFLWMWQTPYE